MPDVAADTQNTPETSMMHDDLGARERKRLCSAQLGLVSPIDHYSADAADTGHEKIEAALSRHALLLARTLRSRRRSDPVVEREIGVARLIAEGDSSRRIARHLDISLHAVERHTEHVLVKLGVRSRTQVERQLSRNPEGPG